MRVETSLQDSSCDPKVEQTMVVPWLDHQKLEAHVAAEFWMS